MNGILVAVEPDARVSASLTLYAKSDTLLPTIANSYRYIPSVVATM